MAKGRIKRGFTLIELMLVVAIIGLLSAIALPKFSNMVIRAKEAAVKGKVGALRSAISIYYADNEGRYPNIPMSLPLLALVPKYIDDVPKISIPTIPTHPSANAIYGAFPMDSLFPFNIGYFYNQGTGQLNINCTHTDSQGAIWSLY